MNGEINMTWEIITHIALAHDVLCVAVRHDLGWAAYIIAVPGKNHKEEADEVSNEGSFLNEDIARAIFPSLYHEFDSKKVIYRKY